MAYNKKRKRGVPTNYIHRWMYKGRWVERKTGPGKWKISFRATKSKRSGKGGPRPGFRVKWGFRNLRQTAVKTRSGQYQTHMTGTKYLISSKNKKKWKKY